MMINNNLGSMQDADKASLPKKVTYARHYGKTQARELSSVPEKLQKPHRNQVAMLILRTGDLDNSAHLRAVQAPGSSSCQAAATRSQHHAHKVITPGNMEPYSKDTNAEHDAVKEAWKQPCWRYSVCFIRWAAFTRVPWYCVGCALTTWSLLCL
jgi:hypothetical protein